MCRCERSCSGCPLLHAKSGGGGVGRWWWRTGLHVYLVHIRYDSGVVANAYKIP